MGGTGAFTGVTVRLAGETGKGFRRAAALTPGWCRVHGGTVTWPRPLEHKAQPHKSDQHHLGEKENRDHDKTPSYRWRNEGILPDFQTVGISRRLAGHDRLAERRTGFVCLGAPSACSGRKRGAETHPEGRAPPAHRIACATRPDLAHDPRLHAPAGPGGSRSHAYPRRCRGPPPCALDDGGGAQPHGMSVA
jgi:hypothetical protein